jgi:hypothetical protein
MVLFPPLIQEHKTGASWGGMQFNTTTLEGHFAGYGYLFAEREIETVREPPHGYLETRVMFSVLLLQLAAVWGMVVFLCQKPNVKKKQA